MKCQNIMKLAMLLVAPLATNAVNCIYDKNDDRCKGADILIVTTLDSQEADSSSFNAVVNTLKDCDISADKLGVPVRGITDAEIEGALYSENGGTKYPAYNVIVFPNGRVSFKGDEKWTSAIQYHQWEMFYDYARTNQKKLVFLNEYPSNYTGTDLIEAVKTDPGKHKVVRQVVPAQSFHDPEVKQAVEEAEIKTEGIYHYPAVEKPVDKVAIEPLLYFKSTPELPTDDLAAVIVNYDGAEYAAFFMPFGEWDTKGSTALNIVWLTWGLDNDFSKIAGSQVSAKDAIKKSNASQTSKLELIFVALCTILAISVTFF